MTENLEPDNQFVHCLPNNGVSHVVVGEGCWCHPVRDADNPTLLMHSPYLMNPIQRMFEKIVGKNERK